MDQQYGLELLRENQKLRDEIERLNDWKRIIENAPGQAKDTAIERFNFTQSIMPIIEIWKEKVQTLEAELQQMKAAVPDYDILEQTSQEGLVNIVVGLMNELEQHKEALNNMSVSLRENVKFYFEIGSKEDLVNYFLTKAKGG